MSMPHLRIIVGVCIAAVLGYAAFSFYAVIVLKDPTMTGDVIGTWKSFAVAAFAFWLGSSSGGKSKDGFPVLRDAAEGAAATAEAAQQTATAIADNQETR